MDRICCDESILKKASHCDESILKKASHFHEPKDGYGMKNAELWMKLSVCAHWHALTPRFFTMKGGEEGSPSFNPFSSVLAFPPPECLTFSMNK
jgi:hypothetical protein